MTFNDEINREISKLNEINLQQKRDYEIEKDFLRILHECDSLHEFKVMTDLENIQYDFKYLKFNNMNELFDFVDSFYKQDGYKGYTNGMETKEEATRTQCG